ncbi:MAG: tetratricopeptide repeat protein [Gammaproteobacteria bacterium]|nr:tetratricopeptide repeat protein [Gammaproteobacteria bacterium]
MQLDDDSALAHAELARALSVQAQWDGRIDLFNEMTLHARAATKIAPDDPAALVASCVAYNNFGRYAEGLAAGTRAIELNPNHADAWACTGFSLSGLQRPAEAITHIQRGLDLSPRDPLLYVWHLFLAHAHVMAGERELAVAENREAVRLYPANFMGQMTSRSISQRLVSMKPQECTGRRHDGCLRMSRSTSSSRFARCSGIRRRWSNWTAPPCWRPVSTKSSVPALAGRQRPPAVREAACRQRSQRW